MHQENDKIERYKIYLRLEKALSANSIDAYLTDLDKLTNFVESEGKKYADVTYDDLQQFVARLRDIGIHPRSQARIISGIKSFYRFLFLDDYITIDPTELLESPKIGLKLPEVLTVNEINSILDTIDLTLPEGQRNRAMLEVLYSCGLRVSELVSLRFTDVYFDEGFIKVEGKGSKQRLVPISGTAIKEIKNYLYDRNHVPVKKGFEDILFLSRRGTALSRIMVFHIIKQQTEMAGIKKNVSPHTFRHSFATHLLEGGANLLAIQEMLGHEKITTTEIYTHIDRQFLRKRILEHHPRSNAAGLEQPFHAFDQLVSQSPFDNNMFFDCRDKGVALECSAHAFEIFLFLLIRAVHAETGHEGKGEFFLCIFIKQVIQSDHRVLPTADKVDNLRCRYGRQVHAIIFFQHIVGPCPFHIIVIGVHGSKELFYRVKRSDLTFLHFLNQSIQFLTRKNQSGKIQPFPATSRRGRLQLRPDLIHRAEVGSLQAFDQGVPQEFIDSHGHSSRGPYAKKNL